MKTIVCVDKNWGIGKKNDLLFKLKGDMQFFKENTMEKTVVMGKNTLISFPNGKPLKNRNNIVLCDDDSLTGVADITVVKSIEGILKAVEDINPDDVFVVGGASVYRQMLPYCTEALITKVDKDGEAEVFFPNLDTMKEWKLIKTGEAKEENGLTFRFCSYKRAD